MLNGLILAKVDHAKTISFNPEIYVLAHIYQRSYGEKMTNLAERFPVAQKDYRCMASQALFDYGVCVKDFDFSERRDLVRARRNGWKIKKGEKYLNQFMICDGDPMTFRAIFAIYKLCLKYDIYEDELS